MLQRDFEGDDGGALGQHSGLARLHNSGGKFLHCLKLACEIITTQDSALQDESEDEVFFGAVHSVEKNGRSKIR